MTAKTNGGEHFDPTKRLIPAVMDCIYTTVYSAVGAAMREKRVSRSLVGDHPLGRKFAICHTLLWPLCGDHILPMVYFSLFREVV